MTAKECIKERRSIRKFKADPVDHKLLSEIIETASYAPSWKHTQITRYIAERDGSFSTVKGASWQMFDAGVATQTFCLAAYEKGLGSVIMGIFDEAKAASLLDIPEERELAALIPVGYPDEAPVAPRRKAVEDLLSFQS